ncbi:MAG: ACP S-malonyltransferase [Erysipelotrichaceae bacterium]
MNIGFLFAGQGAQYVGMGKELYDSEPIATKIYDDANCSFNVKDVCFNGPIEILNDTKYAQPCIVTTSLAIASVLSNKGIVPSMVAGLSLGEYSALAYAKAIGVADVVELVEHRGDLMSNALPLGSGKMAAIIGLESPKLLEICNQVNGVCEIANYNCPGQLVISGETNAIDEACTLALANGARRALPLAVSGAFHSSLLIEASNKFKEYLDKVEFKETDIKVVHNLSATSECKDMVECLKLQMCNSVKMQESIEYMIANGIDTFIEIGPGRTLSGFVRKINKDIKVYNVENIATLNKTIEEIGGNTNE